MKTIRGAARFMAKQVLSILVAAGILVGTVIAMFVAALVVALFGFFGATFFLLAPILGIVMREKVESVKSFVDELSDKLKDLSKTTEAARGGATVHKFKKPTNSKP